MFGGLILWEREEGVSDIFRFFRGYMIFRGVSKKKWKNFSFLVVMLHMCKNCFLSCCWMIFFQCELDVGRASSSFFFFLLFWYTYIVLLYIYTGNTYILYRNSMSAYTNVIVFATCIWSVIFLNYREIVFVFLRDLLKCSSSIIIVVGGVWRYFLTVVKFDGGSTIFRHKSKGSFFS